MSQLPARGGLFPPDPPSLTTGTIFHKTRTPLTKWFWIIWRQKGGISMLSLQRLLDLKSYKTVGTMGHKIRQALAARDADYKLAGLIEMDDTCFGAPKPGKPGRGAAGKAKVVAVETPTHKPRLAAMRVVPRVSRAEIQALVRERLAPEAVIKTDGLKVTVSWILLPISGMGGWCPVRGRKRRRSCPGSTP